MAEISFCQKCKKDLPISDFYFRKETGKYRICCKKCKSLNTKEDIAVRLSSETKICKHCNTEKPISEYQKAGGGKWLQPYCKPCDADRKNKYCEENKDRLKEKKHKDYMNNREFILAKDKAERAANRPETLRRLKELIESKKMPPDERKRRKSESDKKYRENNKEKVKAKKREYYESNGGLQKAKDWQKKMMSDVGFRTKKRLRGRVYVALKRGVKSEGTMQLLGCSIDFFKQYFESLFTEGMNWDKFMSADIEIDHIKPCKLFDLTKEEEQRECFHYTNCQPLWWYDNNKKGATYQEQKTA